MGRKYFVIGTFFGLQLRIDYSWLIIFVLIAWTVITSYIPSYKHGLPAWQATGAGLIVTVIFFLSVIAHEYAHSIVANHRGLRIRRITLFIFGGASELQHEPASAATEMLMTVAGPLTSFLIAGVFAVLTLLASHIGLTAMAVICQPVAVLNLVVGIFNIVPAFPLDGGRILRATIWYLSKNLTTATRWATNTGVAISYVMIAGGLLSILAGDLIGGLWLGIIGFFLLQSARLSYSQIVAQNILSGIHVRDVYSQQLVTVPLGTSVDTFLTDFVLRYKQYDFLATDQSGTPVGIIELARIKKQARLIGKQPVDPYLLPLGKTLRLRLDDPALNALQVMQTHNVDLVPVTNGEELTGVVLRHYLEDYVRVHQLRQANKFSG